MTKRVYTKRGDVYEIKIDDTTKRYMQFIGLDWNQLNSDTFRVYKKVYPIDATPSLEEILSDIPDFYVHSFASAGIKAGLWSLAYRCKNVGDTSSIKFKTDEEDMIPKEKRGEYCNRWSFWHFDERFDNRFLYEGKMPQEWKSAHLGYVYHPVNVLHRIIHGRFSFEPKYLE